MSDLNVSHSSNDQANYMEKFRFDNKIVVITGGAGILGRVFAEIFLGAGAIVILLDINEKALEESEKILGVGNNKLKVFRCNLTNKKEVTDTYREIYTEWGKIDVLVNGAAAKSTNFFEPIEDYYLDDWNAVLEGNLSSMFLCTQGVLKYMQKQKYGSIINIGSIYGVVAPDPHIYEGSEYMGRPINTPVTYAVTKGAVPNFTRYLAVTQAPYGIRSNAVSPGGVYSGQNKTFVENYSRRTPMGRMAKGEEIAAAVLFLASDAASYITGQNLMVDGGWTAW